MSIRRCGPIFAHVCQRPLHARDVSLFASSRRCITSFRGVAAAGNRNSNRVPPPGAIERHIANDLLDWNFHNAKIARRRILPVERLRNPTPRSGGKARVRPIQAGRNESRFLRFGHAFKRTSRRLIGFDRDADDIRFYRAGGAQLRAFGTRARLGIDLTRIPGIRTGVAQTLFGEIGPDFNKFRSASAFASWMGLCPDNDISGGKVA